MLKPFHSRRQNPGVLLTHAPAATDSCLQSHAKDTGPSGQEHTGGSICLKQKQGNWSKSKFCFSQGAERAVRGAWAQQDTHTHTHTALVTPQGSEPCTSCLPYRTDIRAPSLGRAGSAGPDSLCPNRILHLEEQAPSLRTPNHLSREAKIKAKDCSASALQLRPVTPKFKGDLVSQNQTLGPAHLGAAEGRKG